MTSDNAPQHRLPGCPLRERGFTLLEVMCALAILSMVTALIGEMCHTAYEQGSTATDLRDLREAADTVFRRLAYEDGRHADGLRASLDDFYAGWAELPSQERDRWRPYIMEFRRRPRTAAGEAGANGAEPVGGSGTRGRGSSGRGGSGTGGTGTGGTGTGGTGTGGTGTGGTGTGGTGTGGTAAEDEETPGVELMQLTLTIWHEDEPNTHLIVLQTFITPQGDGTGGTSSAGGGGSR